MRAKDMKSEPLKLRSLAGVRPRARDSGLALPLTSAPESSYSDFALIEPERVTVFYHAARLEIRDRAYRLIRHPTPSADSLRAALREMSRFHR
jgi:hypothetical protein